MHNEVFILVEGETDKAFLELFAQNKDFEIVVNGGNSITDNNLTQIQQALNDDKKVCIIFDADNDYKATLNKLKKKIERLENHQKVEIFLFPNNKDGGELETLLENIAVEPKLIQCFECYKKCIGEVGENYLKNINKKSKHYAYIEALGKTEYLKAITKSKEKSNAIDEYIKAFEMDSKHLKLLKEFLGIV